MSRLEDSLAYQIRVAGLPTPEREFTPKWGGRKFRWDFAWTEHRLVVEVQGGTYQKGRDSRHNTGSGIYRDCTKLCLATINGWRQLNFDAVMIRNGEALRYIQKALGGPDA